MNITTCSGMTIAVSSLDEGVSLKIGEFKAIARTAIENVYPAWKQVNAALGLLSSAEADAIRAHITSCRARSDEVEAEIAAIAADGDLSDSEKLGLICDISW